MLSRSFVNACILVLALGPLAGRAFEPEPQTVYTGAWPPYVIEQRGGLGLIDRSVEMVLREMGAEPRRRFLDYYLIEELVAGGDIELAYPFFKTPRREGRLLFSDPLLFVENRIYYSVRHNPELDKAQTLDGLVFGRVIGYSYGEAIDPLLPRACGKSEPEVSCRQQAKAKACACQYNSEALALNALLKNDIDLLPMAASVAETLMMEEFPHHIHALRALSKHRTKAPLFAIFSDNPEGRELQQRFNAALERLAAEGLLRDLERTFFLNRHRSSGYVRLVAAEGFPVVIGLRLRERLDGEPACRRIEAALAKDRQNAQLLYFMIPQGSRALVREWSPMALEAGDVQQLYDRMTAFSSVEVVDGPHAGRRFCVRNMHIAVE